MTERYYRKGFGWGTIIFEAENYFLVKFDAHPWNVEQFPRED